MKGSSPYECVSKFKVIVYIITMFKVSPKRDALFKVLFGLIFKDTIDILDFIIKVSKVDGREGAFMSRIQEGVGVRFQGQIIFCRI